MIKKFRENLRRFEREIAFLSNSNCKFGVTIPQCHSLLEISKNKEVTVNQLSRKLSLNKSTVSRTVEGLVKSELVNRTIPNENRRITKIELSEKGVKTCNDIDFFYDNYFSEVFEVLTEEERDVFMKSFEKITSKMMEINTKIIKEQ